jgi:hypothetical protein
MFKNKSRYGVLVLAVFLSVSIFSGLSVGVAVAEDHPYPDGCSDNSDFTTDFLLEECKFKTKGVNPYFILDPGYRLVLEMPEGEEDRERSVETVLCDTEWINFGDRMVKTRVLEERAFEWDEEEWVLIEISLNWFALCEKTNAIYYFGEFSRDCENGFTDDEQMCEPEEDEGDPTVPVTEGSWRTGENGAMPGLMMPGTVLLGAKYFQEQAPNDGAVDRGEIAEMGLTAPDPEGGPDFTGCVKVFDTNPAEDPPVCDDEDAKIYCPGIGIVQDQDLVLVEYGFVGCGDHDKGND